MLSLSSNGLRFLPAALCRCANLTELNLTANRLTSLPEDLAVHVTKLSKLEITQVCE